MAAEAGVDSPIQHKSELVAALADAVTVVVEFCERYDVDLDELCVASGFAFIALRDAAVSPDPASVVSPDDTGLLTTDGPQVQRIVLTGGRVTRTGLPGPAAALYVMVTANGLAAKVGALEAAANAPKRLRAVEMKQRMRTPAPDGYPIRLAVVAELDGLVLGVYADDPTTFAVHGEMSTASGATR